MLRRAQRVLVLIAVTSVTSMAVHPVQAQSRLRRRPAIGRPTTNRPSFSGLAPVESTQPQPSSGGTINDAELNRFYEQLKDLESRFPIPTPVVVKDVGTFDAATGTFDGLTSTIRTETGLDGKPTQSTILPVLDADAVNVALRFRVKNRQGEFTVTAAGQTVSAPLTQNSITINVGKAKQVEWTIQSSFQTYSDTLRIRRPAIIGMGAFSVRLLPIAVIYAPPQGASGQNAMSYSNSKSIGNTTKVAFRRSGSTTNTNTQSVLGSEWDAMTSFTGGVQKLYELTKGPLGAETAGLNLLVGEGLDLLNSMVGDVTSSVTEGFEVSEQNSLSVITTKGISLTTPDGQRPGEGDMIIFRRDVKLAWRTDEDGVPHLTMIHPGTLSAFSVANIRNRVGGLTQDDADALLSLDPFALGGENANLSPSRFAFVEPLEVSGTSSSGVEYTSTYEIRQSDLSARTDFETKAEETSPGWLQFFLEDGLSDSTTTKTTITNSSSEETTVGQKTSVTLKLVATGDSFFAVDIYFDRVYGTFAVKKVKRTPGAIGPFVGGTVVEPTGAPAAGAPVVLTVGGQKFTTFTDASGNYTFRHPRIPRGDATLRSRGLSRRVVLDGRAIKGMTLGGSGSRRPPELANPNNGSGSGKGTRPGITLPVNPGRFDATLKRRPRPAARPNGAEKRRPVARPGTLVAPATFGATKAGSAGAKTPQARRPARKRKPARHTRSPLTTRGNEAVPETKRSSGDTNGSRRTEASGRLTAPVGRRGGASSDDRAGRKVFRATFDPSKKPDGFHTVHTGPSDERLIAQVRSGKIAGFKAVASDRRKLDVRIIERGKESRLRRSRGRRLPATTRSGPRHGFAMVMIHGTSGRLLHVIEYQLDQQEGTQADGSNRRRRR